MNISSYAQETMCYVGQHLVFSDAEEMINSLTGAGFDAKQIERVCHLYGQHIEDRDILEMEVFGHEEIPPEKAEEPHYVSVDGSMYLTREEGWKEIKLGRIYKAGDIVRTSDTRTLLGDSLYVAHLGGSRDFLPKMEYRIEGLKRKIFIADGAKWIWNWVEDNYPDSVQIVDYYHAKEHLCEFAKTYFKGKDEREQWIDRQGTCMLEKGIGPVIGAIRRLPPEGKSVGDRQRLLNYYLGNEHRMQYHVFREKGLQIGSGAIEAAHRDVLQKRLKLSGQRWTCKGLQQMAQLRAIYKSGKWNEITEICQKAA